MAKDYIDERNGGYYISGTRVSLDSIVQCFNEGLSPEAILDEFDTLTLAQVYGAIAYYLENRHRCLSDATAEAVRSDAAKRAAFAIGTA